MNSGRVIEIAPQSSKKGRSRRQPRRIMVVPPTAPSDFNDEGTLPRLASAVITHAIDDIELMITRMAAYKIKNAAQLAEFVSSKGRPATYTEARFKEVCRNGFDAIRFLTNSDPQNATIRNHWFAAAGYDVAGSVAVATQRFGKLFPFLEVTA